MRARIHIASLIALLSGGAWAEGISGFVDESYSHSNSSTTDPAGNTQHFVSDQLTQRYRLTLDRSFFPLLRFSGGGLFEQSNAWRPATWSRTESAFANLNLSGPILSGAAGYNYRVEKASVLTGPPPALVIEEPSLFAIWRPTGLPAFSLRLSRPHNYDTLRVSQDVVTNLALFSATWSPVRHIDLLYTASYAEPIDRLHHTDSTSISQTGRVNYSNTFEGGITAVAAGAEVSNQRSHVSSSGPGGTIATQQAPLAGLSLVETFPAIPTQDTLVANPALIDGNTTASANLDLGFSVALAGDTNARDFGVQFPDLLGKVNTFYLWVDRELPAQVSGAFRWTVFQSDDNFRWTEVPIAGPVVFGVFQNRFEITIATTTARFLKVVTKPIDPSVTLDKRFSNIFVTELQLFLVTPVGATGWQSNTRASFNTSARRQVFYPNLFYDFGSILTLATVPGGTPNYSYLVTNGLSYSRRLSPILLFNSRLARQDQGLSRSHEGLFLYSAALAATPLPTLSHNLVYSGQTISNAQGFGTTNSLSFFNRATPYRGIGLLAGALATLVGSPSGQKLLSKGLTFNASVQPNPKLTLGGTFAHSDTTISGGGGPRSSSASNRIDGSISFNPVPAFYVSAAISRVITRPRPQTFASGTLSFSPFAGGDLQLAMTYSETRQQPGGTTRLFVPSVRWNIRAGTILSVSYSVLDSAASADPSRTHSNTFTADFQTAL